MVKYTLACGLQECLGNEWMGDNFRDFRVMVDDSEYFCHKFILSACSTFFKTLLRADFKEKQEGYVVLNKMSKETFDVIINAIYKGVDGLTLDNVVNVWQATHLLDIPFLIQELSVKNKMSLENYIQFYHLAKLLNSETVINFSIQFIKKNFEHFRETDTFIELSFPLIFSIVDDDCLDVKSEDLVLESILHWVSYVRKAPDLGEQKENAKEIEKTSLETSLEAENPGSVELNNYNKEISNVNRESFDEIKQTETGAENEGSCKVDKDTTINFKTAEATVTSRTKTDADSETLDRRKCLVELLSIARTFLASRKCLEKCLTHPLIRSQPEAVKIVYEALLYRCKSLLFPSNLAIPYRNSGKKRSVMMFIRSTKIHAYDLNSRSCKQLNLRLRGDCLDLACTESTLCFIYPLPETRACSVYTRKQCRYKYIATLDDNMKTNDIVEGCECTKMHLVSVNGIFVNVCNVESHKLITNDLNFTEFTFNKAYSSASVFLDNILLFSDNTVYCCNVYTKSTNNNDFKGPADHIVTFHKGRKMFILQKDGALSCVKMTEDSKIRFKFVSQLWEGFEWILNGAVYYKNELILFCTQKLENVDKSLLKSIPGIFERISVVEIESQSKLVPFVMPRCWIPSWCW